MSKMMKKISVWCMVLLFAVSCIGGSALAEGILLTVGESVAETQPAASSILEVTQSVQTPANQDDAVTDEQPSADVYEPALYWVGFYDLYGNLIEEFQVQEGYTVIMPAYTPMVDGLVFQYWYDAMGDNMTPFDFGTQIWRDTDFVPYYVQMETTLDSMDADSLAQQIVQNDSVPQAIVFEEPVYQETVLGDSSTILMDEIVQQDNGDTFQSPGFVEQPDVDAVMGDILVAGDTTQTEMPVPDASSVLLDEMTQDVPAVTQDTVEDIFNAGDSVQQSTDAAADILSEMTQAAPAVAQDQVEDIFDAGDSVQQNDGAADILSDMLEAPVVTLDDVGTIFEELEDYDTPLAGGDTVTDTVEEPVWTDTNTDAAPERGEQDAATTLMDEIINSTQAEPVVETETEDAVPEATDVLTDDDAQTVETPDDVEDVIETEPAAEVETVVDDNTVEENHETDDLFDELIGEVDIRAQNDESQDATTVSDTVTTQELMDMWPSRFGGQRKARKSE